MKAYTECGVTTAHATEPTKSPNLKDEREEEEEAGGATSEACAPSHRSATAAGHLTNIYLSFSLSFSHEPT